MYPQGQVERGSPRLPENLTVKSPWKTIRTILVRGKVWFIVLGVLAGLATLVLSADALLDKPLRAWGERTMNAHLKGYTVRLARWDTHIWRLAMELRGLTIVQNAHPKSPVADFGSLDFTISWRALLHLRLLGDLVIEGPHLRIDLAQLQEQAKSEVKLKDRGWQGAIEAIYPLKLENVKIHDGSLLYASADPEALPLRMTKLEFAAQDLRNVQSKRGAFPSPVHMEALLFETGALWFDGAADFLADSGAAIKGRIRIDRVPLDRLGSIAKVVQLRMKGGVLSAHGSVESSSGADTVHLQDVLLENWKADYVTSEATKVAEKKHVQVVAKAAKKADNAPKMLLRIDRFRISRSEVGFVNQTSDPHYRLFFTSFDLEMENLSNQTSLGVAKYQASGDFMGSGHTQIHGGVRPDGKGADFDVHLEMRDAQLASLNDLLLAYTGVDVEHGRFSLFTEINVKNQVITGYIKPLVSDLRVYGDHKDHHKGYLQQGWEHILDGIAYLLKNSDRGEIATVARLTGKVTDPQANNFRVAVGLVRNAFFEAILPGFLAQAGKQGAVDKSPHPATSLAPRGAVAEPPKQPSRPAVVGPHR